MNQTEYRVVNTGVRGSFRCFGEDFDSAKDFMEHGSFNTEIRGIHRLESRPVGGGPKDWVEVKIYKELV